MGSQTPREPPRSEEKRQDSGSSLFETALRDGYTRRAAEVAVGAVLNMYGLGVLTVAIKAAVDGYLEYKRTNNSKAALEKASKTVFYAGVGQMVACGLVGDHRSFLAEVVKSALSETIEELLKKAER